MSGRRARVPEEGVAVRPPLRSSKRDADRVARKLRRAAKIALPLPPLPPQIPSFDEEGFEEDEAPRAIRYAPWTPESGEPPPLSPNGLEGDAEASRPSSTPSSGPPTEETGPPSFGIPASRAPRSLSDRIYSSYPTSTRVVESYSLPPSLTSGFLGGGPESLRGASSPASPQHTNSRAPGRTARESAAPVSRREAAWSQRVSQGPSSERSASHGPESTRSDRGDSARRSAAPVSQRAAGPQSQGPASRAPASHHAGPRSVRARGRAPFAVPVLRPRGDASTLGLRRATPEELEFSKKGVRRAGKRRLAAVVEQVPNLFRVFLTRRGFQWLGALVIVVVTAYLVGRAFVAAAKPGPKAFVPIFLETEEKILWGPRSVWLADAGDVGRPMDRWNRTTLQRGYEAAWRRLFEAKRADHPLALEREFAPPALRGAEDSVDGARVSPYATDEVALEHALELHQYTYDGRVAHVRDRCLRTAFVVRDRKTGASLARGSDEGTFDALLRLEDGYWKISDLQRIGPAACPAPPPLPPLPFAPVRTEGDRFVDEHGDVDVRGINDVRSGLAGGDFVRNAALTKPDTEPPDPLAKVAADFERLGGAGIKFVRIPVHFDGAGGGIPTEIALDRLTRVLDLALRNHLRVLFTLFGGRRNVDLAYWPEVDRHLEAILGTFREHPALFGWDLMNGPDAEFKVQPEDDVLAFLRFVAQRATRYDPDHPRTISWSDPSHACLLEGDLTFVSYSDFGMPVDVARRLGEVRRRCGKKPVVLAEFGFRGKPSEERLQAGYFHAFARGLGRQPFYGFVWTLGDVDASPDDSPLGSEKRRGDSFGLFRKNNRAKPAWLAVRQEFFKP